ncbi:MAG TPA: Rieske 2Fe-2S domain-containing protein [Candidatus Limnocylindria bacterium]|nr:Rieske 2Fe-2S domain-containing protein [Candidatus Limnocylindria bacterium]
MTPARAVAAAFVLSALASVALVVVYVIGGNAQVEGVLLAVALGGIGAGIVIWAIRLLDVPIEVEEHESLASSPEERSEAVSAAELETVSRRRFLVRLLLGAGAALTAALAIPALSLGPHPARELFTTGWRQGSRVVDAAGTPIRPGDLGPGTVRTVFPEDAIGRADAATLLIRVRPADLRLEGDRASWAPEGAIGYSKICTHAGCPVGLYRAEDNALLCPCHQSTFDVLRGAVPTFGPAVRRLPQLPMGVDSEGFLVALADFPEPVGPSFWNVTHEVDG